MMLHDLKRKMCVLLMISINSHMLHVVCVRLLFACVGMHCVVCDVLLVCNKCLLMCFSSAHA